MVTSPFVDLTQSDRWLNVAILRRPKTKPSSPVSHHLKYSILIAPNAGQTGATAIKQVVGDLSRREQFNVVHGVMLAVM